MQAHVHGLSKRQRARLAEFEASLRKEEKVLAEGSVTPGESTLLEQSIPSVPTLEQLPYLNIE